jgi:hypothetical protein
MLGIGGRSFLFLPFFGSSSGVFRLLLGQKKAEFFCKKYVNIVVGRRGESSSRLARKKTLTLRTAHCAE